MLTANNTLLLKLIHILSDGEIHSFKLLSNELGINKNLLKKCTESLKSWGCRVHKNCKGYFLEYPIQLLSSECISNYFPYQGITLLPIVDSTNQYFLKKIDILQSGDICIAEYQYKGRGRYGKIWLSPFGTNLYFSLFWNFKKSFSEINISLLIAIIIAHTLEEIGTEKIIIKWPNDIYINDRKLAGILIDNICIGDNTKSVIGVGINLYMTDANLATKWISLKETNASFTRNQLLVKLISNILSVLKSQTTSEDLRNIKILFDKKYLNSSGTERNFLFLSRELQNKLLFTIVN